MPAPGRGRTSWTAAEEKRLKLHGEWTAAGERVLLRWDLTRFYGRLGARAAQRGGIWKEVAFDTHRGYAIEFSLKNSRITAVTPKSTSRHLTLLLPPAQRRTELHVRCLEQKV